MVEDRESIILGEELKQLQDLMIDIIEKAPALTGALCKFKRAADNCWVAIGKR